MKNFDTYWKTLANSKKAKRNHVIQRAVLVAMASKSNVDKIDIVHSILLDAFTPITNKNKLANGRTRYDSIDGYDGGGRGSAKFRNPSSKVLDVAYSEILETDAEIDEFNALLDAINVDSMDKYYTYVFVRQDITPEQVVVQAAHATMVAGAEAYKNRSILPPTSTVNFVVVGVPTEAELWNTAKILKGESISFETFRESDMNHQTTALATHPIRWDKRANLLDYPLLTFGEKPQPVAA